jgi:hypothetical protein
MPDYYTNALTEALRRLGSSPFLQTAVSHLQSHTAVINEELSKTVLAEIPAFSESRNPDILPELGRHGSQHTDEIVRLLGGGAMGSFDFVREHARRRAEQRFPLEATLHAYRCGHKVFSRWMREAALAAVSSPEDAQQGVAAVADFAIEYTDAVSTIAAGAYSSHTRLLADVAGDQRAQLLSILLDGYDESDGRVAQILRDAGYLETRQSFCVALAHSVDSSEMTNPARARRLADAVDKVLQNSPWRRLIDLRQNKVIMVLSNTSRISGWTVPQTSLARRVKDALFALGNAVLIGVSNDVPSTSHIPTAHRQATLALELVDVVQRVLQFSEIPARCLLLHLAGGELQRVLPAWTSAFLRADDHLRGALLATLRAYADADMNVLKAAERLGVHPNTVYSRLQRIIDITGLDARNYHALTELLIIADCTRRPLVGGSD